MSDLKQTLPSSTRALPFTNDPTTIETITTSTDVVFTLDETNAVDGTTVSLAILQNHPVDFPACFIELAGSRQPVLGKMNHYILARLNGFYQFVRYQSIDDAADTADVVVGVTLLSAGAATSTTFDLSWTTATNATQYVLKRYSTSDYSDAPVTVYSGPNLSFTDTGLSAGTHYYYKINPATTTATGRAAFVDGSTNTSSETKITLLEHIFNDYSGFSGYFPPIEMDGGVNKAHFVSDRDNATFELFQPIPGFVAGDHLRITLNARFGNSPAGKRAHAYLGGIENYFTAADVQNEMITLNFTTSSNDVSLYFGIQGGNSGVDFYLREIKIEKITSLVYTKLTGTPFGTVNYSGTPNGTYDKIFDGDMTTFFDAADGSNGYAGMDIGTAKIVSKIRVAPRASLESRSLGMVLQGSNTSASDGYTNLFTIPDILPANVLTEYAVSNTTAYKYYRIYSSTEGFCNLSELELYSS